MRYSNELGDLIYIKNYEFLTFAKNMSNKYCQRNDSAKKSTTEAIKTASNRAIPKNDAEATGDLIGNKIANKITGV